LLPNHLASADEARALLLQPRDAPLGLAGQGQDQFGVGVVICGLGNGIGQLIAGVFDVLKSQVQYAA
jgi:hypothetical protein